MKTILLHIRADNGMESRLQAAFDLSRATGAHISCLQIAPLPELVAADLYGSGYLVPEAIDAVRRQDEEIRLGLEERLRREGMSWDWHYRNGDLVQGLLETGRLADAMLVSLPPPGRRQVDDPAPIVADLAVNSRAPVLAIPSMAKGFRCTGRAMVAWDGSHEAASALTAGRPFWRSPAKSMSSPWTNGPSATSRRPMPPNICRAMASRSKFTNGRARIAASRKRWLMPARNCRSTGW
ncbi:hypothetical protein ACFSUK_24955 [Sphingobium scionense]